jgi:excinuclease ABC subunit A
VEQFFDPAKVVAHPELSLAGGAVRGWDRRNAYYFQMINSLGRHYDFDPETPWERLPKKIHKILLFGSGSEQIEFSYFNERGRSVKKRHPFEGVMHNMQRRYRETESNSVREELARYISTQPCPDCGGSRLTEAARHVFVDTHNLPSITALPIVRAKDYFDALKLPGKQGKIAEKIVKEIVQRLNFLVNVGLDYLTLERSAETLSGGEAQRIRRRRSGGGDVRVGRTLDRSAPAGQRTPVAHPDLSAGSGQHGDRGGT